MAVTADIARPEFWREFAPGLHVVDRRSAEAVRFVAPPEEQLAAIRAAVQEEGYFHASGVKWPVDVRLMAQTVRALDAAGLSPVFAFVYDEFWMPFHSLHPIYQGLLGDYRLLPDFWVWNVDPARGQSGWRPHRDKGRQALFPDGTPKSITTWMPLSKATPLNGCMYIVPANHDPTYNTPQEGEWNFELPSVRALPAEPGDVFMWNQAVLHWGSKTSPRGGESRVSMAFEFQRADVPAFNAPLLEPLQLLDFASRLKLIAKQVLQYRHMYQVAPQVEQAAMRILDPATAAG